MNHRYLITLLLAAGALQIHAQPAYRSVDEQGNVTFSDTPVPGAVEETRIKIDAPVPSQAEVEESQRQATEMLEAAGEAGTSTAPSQAAQQDAAKRAVQEAEQQLEEAREVREGDRIGTASGGSRLTPQYLERVQAAEEKLDTARKQLQATQ